MSRSVIVAGSRTAIGKLSGAFASVSAQDLGGVAIKGALERAGVDPQSVDAVLMGQVIQAGQGQITARQAAVAGGVPMSVHATTINKVCLSGLQTLYLADLMIRAGEAAVVVAGGMESMTNAPYLLPGARAGYRIGDQKVVDSMMFDGLTCAFDHCAMGLATERYNAGAITRQRQDEFSARSHQLAAAAIASGRFAEEIVPVAVAQRKGDPLQVATDEGVRGETTVESLAALRGAFEKDGTITAGNASQISDGAAALIVMSEERCAELGLTPLGELVSYGQVAGPDASLLTQPSRAIQQAAAKAQLDVKGLDLFEINEAFAAVGLASADDLGIDENKINVNGGAIALGHPVGMSGTRLALTALYELRRRGGGVAAVALCGGGGQGDGAILRSL
ncbi:MAG: acetyl-CoA C-acetyltransferase [Acidobacteriota bacterium]|nr:acetyl-CoA C-acetyltransferase [Acidobacteriota bacterium]MDE3044095.1 acetyl-CoA C-acetyltransferase [Acidobacteriota bacterium]MDE3222444.1 acetyl-CoA C-acetyltransferase [Acidobacteriota bacterium]